MASGKNAIGLDIGSHSIKLIQLKETGKGVTLQNFSYIQLPPEAIVDGSLMNSSDVVSAIQELVKVNKLRNKDVAVSISGHSVIIKKISLPEQTIDELEESIQWEAEQYIPFDIKDVNVDVEILNPKAGQGQMDVLLVAAKKDVINEYMTLILEANLNPVVVDVDCFALQNQFELNYGRVPDQTIALVNVGASVININIVSNGVTTFTRDITMGGDLVTGEIQKQLNVNYDEAETYKTGGGMDEDAGSIIPQEVEKICEMVSETLVNEIQRSLDFFAATTVNAGISRIYLSGGSSKMPALVKTLERTTEIPVEQSNPFKNVIIDNRRFDLDFLQTISPMAAVSVGLGLRRGGER
ncbi:MAG: type IV pilus assembly protein PilM [Myxococcales bacterium]|nr:type IV pilus assembly protein PilM [Myxococcales bacterium]